MELNIETFKGERMKVNEWNQCYMYVTKKRDVDLNGDYKMVSTKHIYWKF